jgi:hypothetical protein
VPMFEYFSYPIMVLATGSMFYDWGVATDERLSSIYEVVRQPLANGDLITALVFVTAFALIYLTNKDEGMEAAVPEEVVRPLGWAVATLGVFVLYNAFRLEIVNYYHMKAGLLLASEQLVGIRDPQWFSLVWQVNYTMAFLIGLAGANLWKLASSKLAVVNSLLAILTLLIFVTAGLYAFYELQVSYISAGWGGQGAWLNIGIRYISYAFVAGLLYMFYVYSRSDLLLRLAPGESLRIGFEALVSTVIFLTASRELMGLMALFNIADAEKLGLSILWGVYALALIGYGIAFNRKHLRIAAIVLLAVTLVKLFFYDAADLETIPKTILFVTIGITLLVASFLYNKYKALIFGLPTGSGESGL